MMSLVQMMLMMTRMLMMTMVMTATTIMAARSPHDRQAAIAADFKGHYPRLMAGLLIHQRSQSDMLERTRHPPSKRWRWQCLG